MQQTRQANRKINYFVREGLTGERSVDINVYSAQAQFPWSLVGASYSEVENLRPSDVAEP